MDYVLNPITDVIQSGQFHLLRTLLNDKETPKKPYLDTFFLAMVRSAYDHHDFCPCSEVYEVFPVAGISDDQAK